MDDNRSDPKKLFRTMNEIMHRVKSNPMPDNASEKGLANDFVSYFKAKTDNIRAFFDKDIEPAFEYDNAKHVDYPFLFFTEVQTSDICDIILASPDKYCALDPIPISLLKKCVDLLSPVITRIVNLSLITATVPTRYKQALVTPLLKKPTLATELGNYRPVSNLSFISKLIEECVIRQLSVHIVSNGLGEILQSAYKPNHSTETALLHVLNEIYGNLDTNNIVFVALLDLSCPSTQSTTRYCYAEWTACLASVILQDSGLNHICRTDQ